MDSIEVAVRFTEAIMAKSNVTRKGSDLAVKDLPSDLVTPYYVGSQTEHLFWGPVSVTLDADNRLYVTEHNRHRFQVYSKV